MRVARQRKKEPKTVDFVQITLSDDCACPAPGALLARTSPWSLALTVPWLWSNWPAIRNDVWPPKRWKRAAARLALEVPRSSLLAAALAYGSIRNRTVVL